mgnify:CR=1 FL=1
MIIVMNGYGRWYHATKFFKEVCPFTYLTQNLMLIFSNEAKLRMRQRLSIMHESLCVADIAKNWKSAVFSKKFGQYTIHWDIARYVVDTEWIVVTVMLKSCDDNPELVRKNNKLQWFTPISCSEKHRMEIYNAIFT